MLLMNIIYTIKTLYNLLLMILSSVNDLIFGYHGN